MDPKVSIIMGSTSDLPVMEKAAKVLNDFCIPFEINALSAHRTPAEVESFATNAQQRGIEVIIAGDGMDALLAIAQMPPGIPVATTAINGAMNAGILAAQILAVGDSTLKAKILDFKASLKKKIVDANQELAKVKYDYKTN